MTLVRHEKNGQVYFTDADTGEIVQTEYSVQSPLEKTPTPSHTSILGSIITITGVLVLLLSVTLIFMSFLSPLISIATLPAGVGLFVSAILLFAVAELVHNAQHQTKLLITILETQAKGS